MRTGKLHAFGQIIAEKGIIGVEQGVVGIKSGREVDLPNPLPYPIDTLYIATDTKRIYHRDRCGDWIMISSMYYKDIEGIPDFESLKGYIHYQRFPATTWWVRHNLGRYPQVLVLDPVGLRIDMPERHPSTNEVVLTSHQPTVGMAVLS